MILLLLLQFLMLLLTSAGWGFWVHQLVHPHAAFRLRTAALDLSLGFALQILLLQNLVYLNVPVRYGFGVPILIGAAGVYFCLRAWPPVAAKLRFPKEFRWAAATVAVIFLVQSYSVIVEGYNNFYGKAHIDHANYTLLSEFLLEKPHGTPLADLKLQPWMLKPMQYRDLRIGQSIAQAYTAALVLGHSQEAYAPVSIFLAVLVGLITLALARTVSLPPLLAAASGIWAGTCPATTRIFLEGFLSQSATLFVFPALILWARTCCPPFEKNNLRTIVVPPAILLSYLLVCYTEYYVIGIAVFGLLTLVFVCQSGITAFLYSGVSVLLSLALVPRYVPKALAFATVQYQVASGRSDALEVLAPNAGTLTGWAEVLVGFPLFSAPMEHRLLVLAGMLLAVLCAVGLFRVSLRTRSYLICAALAPWVFLGVLASAPVFVQYPYGKIMDSFAPIWALLASLGMVHTWLAFRRQRSMVFQYAPMALPAGIFLAGLAGGMHHHQVVTHHDASVALLTSAGVKQAFTYAEANPNQNFLIKDASGLFTAWAAYHARDSRVFIDAPTISDLPVPRNLFEFTTLSKIPGDTTMLYRGGFRNQSNANGLPIVVVNNPQGQDGQGDAVWYWLGDDLDFEIFTWGAANSLVEHQLTFQAEPGPANPSPIRRMSLTSLRDGSQSPIAISGAQKVSVPIRLKPGNNVFHLETGEPKEHLVKLPGDARKHLVRLSGIEIQRGVAVPAGENAAEAAEGPLSKPLLVVHNPQSEDRAGDARWYWLGKSLEFEVVRPDSTQQDYLYQFNVQVQPGPANPNPKRRLQIKNLQDGVTKIFDFEGDTILSMILNVKPGTSKYAVDLLAPLEQTVKIPNDPRIHMVRMQNFDLKLIRGAVRTPETKGLVLPRKALHP